MIYAADFDLHFFSFVKLYICKMEWESEAIILNK